MSRFRRQAEQLAKEAGLRDAEEAFCLLDAGKLDGTLLEAELRSILFLEYEHYGAAFWFQKEEKDF